MLKDEIILKDRMIENKLGLVNKFDANNLFIDVQDKVSILGNKQNFTSVNKKSARTKTTKLRYPKNGLYGLL